MSTDASPRVNSARLGDFIGRTVRLVCKVEHIKGMSAIVRASDQGQVEVRMTAEGQLQDPYVEVIGRVLEANVLKLEACINMGTDLDMTLINDCIEMTHDARFSNMF